MLSFAAVDSQGYSLSQRIHKTQLMDSSCLTQRDLALCFSKKTLVELDMNVKNHSDRRLGYQVFNCLFSQKDTKNLWNFFLESLMFTLHSKITSRSKKQHFG